MRVLSHGCPIAEPQDVVHIQRTTRGVVGFVGASSLESMAVERPMADAAIGLWSGLCPALSLRLC